MQSAGQKRPRDEEEEEETLRKTSSDTNTYRAVVRRVLSENTNGFNDKANTFISDHVGYDVNDVGSI
jgi:hypothetical protein